MADAPGPAAWADFMNELFHHAPRIVPEVGPSRSALARQTVFVPPSTPRVLPVM